MIITFTKPLKFEDKEYTQIDLNLDRLTGQDMIDADVEARICGDKTAMIELSKQYQAILAAKSAGVSSEMIKSLSAKEFSKVTAAVFNFLFE